MLFKCYNIFYYPEDNTKQLLWLLMVQCRGFGIELSHKIEDPTPLPYPQQGNSISELSNESEYVNSPVEINYDPPVNILYSV